MVIVQCPHCGEDIELENGFAGLFDCPYCDEDFEWNGDPQMNDLKIKIILFLFGLFSPILIYFVSLWMMIAVFPPNGLEIILYFLISIGICVVYTVSLAIYCALTKNKPLFDGVLLSIGVSIFVIYMYVEVL